MVIHKDMFDKNAEGETTYHRVFVQWENGDFISLGIIDTDFQEMVKDLGPPKLVEFRDTNEMWVVDDEEVTPGSAVEDK